MKVKIRKSSTRMAHNNLLEWQPIESKNGNRYLLNRNRVVFNAEMSVSERAPLTRQLFNSLYLGLEAIVEAKYNRKFKLLEVTL